MLQSFGQRQRPARLRHFNRRNSKACWICTTILQKLRNATGDVDPIVICPELVRETWGVYSFNAFTQDFCDRLLKLERHTLSRPAFGLKPVIDQLSPSIQVLADAFFQYEARLVHHHAFTVRSSDNSPGPQTDDADIIFNVRLAGDFDNSTLIFCGDIGEPDHRLLSHVTTHHPGQAIVHLGMRRQGAPATSADQQSFTNLVMWSKAAPRYTRTLYKKELRPPDLACVSATHDRDYFALTGTSPTGALSKAWCPPAHAQYANFYARLPS